MAAHILHEFFTPELRDPPPSVERGCPPETPEQLVAARERDREFYEYMAKHFGVTEGGDLVTKEWRGGNGKPVGSVLGCGNGEGYLHTRVLGKSILNHKLLWVMHFGRLPRAGLLIDHIDQDKRNNRIENLRESSKQFNGLNSHRNDNTLPHGVSRTSMNGRHYIRASIQHPTTRKNLTKQVQIKPWALDASHGHPKNWALNPDGEPVRAADELQAIEVASAWWQQQQQALYGQAM